MNARIYILILLLHIPALFFGQNNKSRSLQGSWTGKIISENPSMCGRMKIEFKGDKTTGFIEFPYKEDFPFDKIRIIKDSLYADASTSLGQIAFFEGLIMSGDTLINGLWNQNRDSFPLQLSLIKASKANLKPQFDGYKIIKLIESTPLKFQQSTQTCWSYATTSFIETEAIRLGKSPVVLSPMFFVTPTYVDKAEKHIRMNGNSWFGEGDLTFSVLKAYKEFGAIPERIYSGKIDFQSIHDHREMNRLLSEKVYNYVKFGRGKMTTECYRKDIKEIISKTMGSAPESFLYNGKEYTPKSFAKEMIGINPDDYVEITSYNHHPLYSKFILEIESNWNNNYYLNLPIDDFAQVIDNALVNNYSVCWDGDVCEGFKNGFAILTEPNNKITQQVRQMAYDNHTTEDVHNMHIIGIAENGSGKRFYIIKNSSDGSCGGYMYMSKDYLLLKTISVMVNKEAIPQVIKNKLSNIL